MTLDFLNLYNKLVILCFNAIFTRPLRQAAMMTLKVNDAGANMARFSLSITFIVKSQKLTLLNRYRLC
jgi:hypothetical protein